MGVLQLLRRRLQWLDLLLSEPEFIPARMLRAFTRVLWPLGGHPDGPPLLTMAMWFLWLMVGAAPLASSSASSSSSSSSSLPPPPPSPVEDAMVEPGARRCAVFAFSLPLLWLVRLFGEHEYNECVELFVYAGLPRLCWNLAMTLSFLQMLTWWLLRVLLRNHEHIRMDRGSNDLVRRRDLLRLMLVRWAITAPIFSIMPNAFAFESTLHHQKLERENKVDER